MKRYLTVIHRLSGVIFVLAYYFLVIPSCFALKDVPFSENFLSPQQQESLQTTDTSIEPVKLPGQTMYDGVSDLLMQETVRQQALFPDIFITIHCPQGLMPSIDERLEQWMKSLFNHTRKLEFDQDLSGKKSIYTFNTTYTITRPSDKAISVNFYSWQYTGGAHNMWENTILNFDLVTGNAMTIDQLFPTPEVKKAVLQYLSTPGNVASKNTPQNESPQIEVSEEDLDITRFILLPEGLRIVFNPYEKASFSMGTITLDIPLKEFEALGIPITYWQP